jgi:two-component system, OmpR family, phosphate regulon sensor histidine kinase PhoR
MRLRIHHALFVGFLGVIGLLVALTLVLVGSGLNRELSATFEAELERQLRLGVALMERSSGMAADELARLITARIDYRVTIIDTSGAVLGESYVDSARVRDIENHLSRPEVRGVVERGERVSFSERSSATVGDPLLYGATLGTLDGVPVVLRMGAPRVEIERAVDRVQRAVAVAGMLAMMVALVAAYLLSKVFARPLVALADRARRLAKGDFSGRAPQSGVSELRDVAVAFNRLSDELRARLTELGEERDEMQVLIDCMAEGVVALSEDGRLMRTNRTARALLHLPEMTAHPPIGAVVRHPALRESLEGSLDGDGPAKEMELSGRHLLVSSRTLDHGGAVTTLLDITEIRRLEAVRRDFVANASHELKTPLTSIRGYAEALIESDPPEELRRRFLEAIHGNTMRLQHLVDDLLDLSRLESGGWSAGSERVQVDEVAQEAWDMVAPSSSGHARDFDVEGEACALADRQGLVQIFRNLFENAVRHTEDGGRIHVDVSTAPAGFVTVAVSDDGEGIPARALPRIFERFYRADSSRARDVGGTGLGLAIVKHLVGAMGGEIEAESLLGQGTTIRFTLPVA